MSPRPGPPRNPIAIRLSDDELAAVDQWAKALGLTNYDGEPNRSATFQWLATPPVADAISRLIEAPKGGDA